MENSSNPNHNLRKHVFHAQFAGFVWAFSVSSNTLILGSNPGWILPSLWPLYWRLAPTECAPARFFTWGLKSPYSTCIILVWDSYLPMSCFFFFQKLKYGYSLWPYYFGFENFVKVFTCQNCSVMILHIYCISPAGSEQNTLLTFLVF